LEDDLNENEIAGHYDSYNKLEDQLFDEENYETDS